MKKLRVNYTKATYGVLLTDAIVFVAFYMIFGSKSYPLTMNDIILICAFILITIVYLIAVFKTFSIQYDNEICEICRFGKTDIYKFDNVMYLDIDYSEKHKCVTFYTYEAKLKFLAFDKDKKLLDVFKKNCRKNISREEMLKRYPNLKL